MFRCRKRPLGRKYLRTVAPCQLPINVRALTDARSRSGVNGEAELFARPVKPFGRGRPRLRRMRAVMQIQLRGRARIEIWRGCAAELGPSQRQAKRRLEQESPANTVV